MTETGWIADWLLLVAKSGKAGLGLMALPGLFVGCQAMDFFLLEE